MAKPQPWPADTYKQAEIITQQNDLLVLWLVIILDQLKKDNLGMLEALLPFMKEEIENVYEAAVELGPYIENRPSDKLPLWAKQASRIVDQYPALMIKLRGLEPKIKANRVVEIRRAIVEAFNTTARIQVALRRIPTAKNGIPVLFFQPVNLDRFTEK